MATEEKKLTHPTPPAEGQMRRYFARFMALLLYFLISSPSLFYRRNRHPDPDRMILQGTIPLSSQSASFQNKVTIPCLNTSSPWLLACHVDSEWSSRLVASPLLSPFPHFSPLMPSLLSSPVPISVPPHPPPPSLPSLTSAAFPSVIILSLIFKSLWTVPSWN